MKDEGGRLSAKWRAAMWLAAAGLLAVVLLGVHLALADLPLTATSPLAAVDRLFDLGLAAALLGLLAALGWRVTGRLGLAGSPLAERLPFAVALGWGIIAYATFGLGTLGLLNPWLFLLLLAALALFLRRDIAAVVHALAGAWRQASWRPTGILEWLLAVLCALILLVALLEALAPPTDYDGLMYHLVAPQRWIAQGRMAPDLDIVQANYPATVEMLYTIALLFGSDVAAKLLHWTLGAWGALAVWALTDRFLTRRAAWIAAATLLSIPTVYFLLGSAYIDLGWSTFEFLALYAVIVWGFAQGRRDWLVLAGLCAGLALGSKYLALYTVGLLGLGVVCAGCFVRRERWAQTIGNAALFGLTALLVASPWYIKNAALLGNPVYPYFFGGAEWDATRVARFAAAGSNYGLGHDLVSILRLPIDVYWHSERFSHVALGFLSLLFWLAPLFVLLAWRERLLRFLAALALVRLLLWAISVQDFRYCLPYWLLLAVVTGAAADRLVGTGQRVLRRDLAGPLLVGYVLVMFYLQAYVFLGWNPLPAVVGLESRAHYLRRMLVNGPALAYINEELPAAATVLFLGEGQSYYCRPTCIPDTHDLLAHLVHTQRTPEGLLAWMRARGVTHVLARYTHTVWQSDSTTAWMRPEVFDTFGVLRDRYLIRVYADDVSEIFEVRYPTTAQ